MNNYLKKFKTREEIKKFIVECNEFSSRDNQYRVGLNGIIIRGKNLEEMIDTIAKFYKINE